jgi:hypothetical protein
MHAIPLQLTVRREVTHRDQETWCPPGRLLCAKRNEE